MPEGPSCHLRVLSPSIETTLMMEDRWQIPFAVECHLLEAAYGGDITTSLEFIHQGFRDLELLHFQCILDANDTSFPGFDRPYRSQGSGDGLLVGLQGDGDTSLLRRHGGHAVDLRRQRIDLG